MSQPVGVSADSLYPGAPLVRSVLNIPWQGIEVQSGKLTHWSSHLPGTASASAVFLRASGGLFIAASSVDQGDVERFFLTILESGARQAQSFRNSARPGIAQLDLRSSQIVPDSFTRSGPFGATVGLAKLSRSTADQVEFPAPPVWISFRCASDIFFMYADDEIPLNVGITKDKDAVERLVHGLGHVTEIEIV